MIPYAKFFASRRVMRPTSAYAVARRSSHEDECGLAREAGARRLRPLLKMSQPADLERVERGQPTAGEERDRPPEPPADPRAQHLARGEQRPPRAPPRTAAAPRSSSRRPVERRIAEACAGPPPAGRCARARGRAARPAGSSRAGGRCTPSRSPRRARLVELAQDAEHEAPARVGRVHAVLLQVRPRLVLAHPLVHAIRLDQPQERLARQLELANRRLHVPQAPATPARPRTQRRPPARARRAPRAGRLRRRRRARRRAARSSRARGCAGAVSAGREPSRRGSSRRRRGLRPRRAPLDHSCLNGGAGGRRRRGQVGGGGEDRDRRRSVREDANRR